MRICVFGAGSLGSAVGGMLAEKHEVSLIGRRQHVEAINKKGLALQGDLRRTVRVPAFTELSHVDPPELLLITTKAYDTRNAIAECRRWATGRSAVLTLQNGIGNLELLTEWKGRKAFGATTTLGATLVSPGRVRVSGLGMTAVGSPADPESAKLIVSAFVESGIPAAYSADIAADIWSKAIVSACINPVTAILRVPNGALLQSKAVSRLLREISVECERIARAERIILSHIPVYPHVRSVARKTAGNLSSMLQDVMKGKRTEVDEINGAIWSLSQKHGLDAPLNRAMTSMVTALEQRKSSQG